MHKHLMVAASVAALIVAAPAMAESGRSSTEIRPAVPSNDMNTGSNHNPQRNLATVPPLGAEDLPIINNEGTRNEAVGIRGALIDNATANRDYTYITIDSRNVASKIIGQDVLSTNGEVLAKVEDIIIDGSGKATLVVVSSGGLMGLGEKKAAFDYNILMRQNAEGDLMTPLTETSVKKAADFSYEAKAGDTVRVIPAGGYSVAKLLKANVVDNAQKDTASVRDIVMSDGKASRVIVGFNKVMGMGGDNAVLFFDQMRIVQKDNAPQFQLSAAQSLEFDRFKTSVARSN